MNSTASGSALEPASASPWRNPWVLGWIGLVVVVLAVNITMVTLAFVTNPGLVVDDYYERGRAMEQSIRSRSMAGPGWMLSLDIPDELVAGQAAAVRFFAVDQAGRPVTPDQVDLFVYRPADAGQDFSVPMAREAAGRYRADLNFPQPGVWDTLVAVTSDGTEYQLSQRVTVQQARH